MMNAKQRRNARRRLDALIAGPLSVRAAADVCAECGILEGVEIRSIDEKARQATFVAATETGVRTYSGREYLRMAGARLQRYRSNPVILDSHNRFEVGAVIGRADVSVDKDGRRLLATVTFATTQRAEDAWTLVKGGFVRALSVGFIPNEAKTLRLEDGQVDGEGDNEVRGPGKVVKEWELFEISVVPVPADPNALRRSLERNFDFLRNLNPEPQEDGTMAGESKDPKTQAQPATPPAEPAKPADELAEERAARIAKAGADAAKARREEVLAFTPENLRARAEALLLDEKNTPAQIRAKLLEESAGQQKPVGTAEPAPVESSKDVKKDGEGERAEPKELKEVDDDLLKRTLCG